MKANVKDILVKQADWQKSRKADSWGDKIRQAESARDSLGRYAYRASGTCRALGEGMKAEGQGMRGDRKGVLG